MSQTTVNAGGQAIGVPGQVADSGPHDIVSGFSKEATAQIPFGCGVRQNPSVPDSYLLPTGFSGVQPIAGINLFDFNHQRAGNLDPSGNQSGDLGATGLLPNAGMQLMRKGRALVPVEVAVVPGDRAWCRGIATGAFGVGMWVGTSYATADTTPSYHVNCTNQGVFRSGTYTAADGTTKVAVLEVDFTSKGF